MDTAFDIYLASKSPRRRELLGLANVRFQLLDIDVDESLRADESPAAYVERVARDKASAGVVVRTQDRPVLGADTTVVCAGEIFGKPRDGQDAARMLGEMSDRSHQVITGVALADQGRLLSITQSNMVTMTKLNPAMIEAYWNTGEPCDKAGAYAIQGLGAGLVRHLEGSFSGVMGLPLFETLKLMGDFAVPGYQQPEDFLSGAVDPSVAVESLQ